MYWAESVEDPLNTESFIAGPSPVTVLSYVTFGWLTLLPCQKVRVQLYDNYPKSHHCRYRLLKQETVERERESKNRVEIRSEQQSRSSHVSTFGVVSGGGAGKSGALFGVVESIVVSVCSRGVHWTAGDHTASQQTKCSAHPTRIQGEAEGHQAPLVMGPDGKPHGGDDAAKSWEWKNTLNIKL